jgi:DNA mismatch endonuclease, patch repair protein
MPRSRLKKRVPRARKGFMRRFVKRNTGLELRVRRLLFAMGYRYRLHTDLPGTPDVAFPRRRIAVFMHGCFWHQHGCSLCRQPKSNLKYWGPKFERNKQRDYAAYRALRALGWKVVIVWECEKNDARLRTRLQETLGAP